MKHAADWIARGSVANYVIHPAEGDIAASGEVEREDEDGEENCEGKRGAQFCEKEHHELCL